MLNIVYHTQRVFRKLRQLLRERAFKEAISCPHNSFTLVGNITLINRDVKIGKKVTIYPNVMFFGDGSIEIGDNVAIGNNTIIYSSKDGDVKLGNHRLDWCQYVHNRHGSWYKMGRTHTQSGEYSGSRKHWQ